MPSIAAGLFLVAATVMAAPQAIGNEPSVGPGICAGCDVGDPGPMACRPAGCRLRKPCWLGCMGGPEDVSQFNCCCRGSYKYPVPPQSTYFWPGIYAERTMTQYVSPYRYPPLRPLPPEGPGADTSHWGNEPIPSR